MSALPIRVGKLAVRVSIRTILSNAIVRPVTVAYCVRLTSMNVHPTRVLMEARVWIIRIITPVCVGAHGAVRTVKVMWRRVRHSRA